MAESEPPALPAEPSTPPSGSTRKVALRNLFLDPNNYRFIDQKEYFRPAEEKLLDPDVQRRTSAFILGRDSEEVSDLIASFKKNGWLPLDQIQVKESARGKYIVVEGNRRVATLQYLERRYKEGGIDLGSLDPKIFDAVPVVLYEDAGDAHHKVIMGLGHISGKRRWPPVNQARLLKSLLTDDKWTEDEVCKAIGVSKRELRSMMKTLALCDLYRSSDYGDQFAAEKYNLFREIVRSRAVSQWIKWNDLKNIPENQANVERLFSWISREDDLPSDDDSEAQVSSDPVITTGADVRELAKIVTDENALRTLDETRRLTDATFSSAVLVQDRLSEGLTRISDSIGILFNHAPKLSEEQIGQVQTALKKLRLLSRICG